MKSIKKILYVFLGFIALNSYAQHELRVDIADALALRTLETSYEFYVSEQSSVGVSTLFNFEGRGSDFRYNEDQMITPFFRHYFESDTSWNFFGELFLGINFGEDTVRINSITLREEYTDGALGIAVGTKYVSNGGLVIDIHGGLGRNLFGSDSPAIVPRVGLGVGYQF